MITTRFPPILTLLSTALMTLTACGQSHYYHDGVSYNYPARAHLRQQADLYHDALSPVCDEETPPHLDLCDCDCGEWERKTYETADDWLERLHLTLCTNSQQIGVLERMHAEIATEEQAQAREIQALLRRNEQLRILASEASDSSHAEAAYRDVVLRGAPPFVVHLVKPGDTLYSIAMKYYGTSDTVSQIVSWNQGWIRHPNELVAGLGLVLFSRDHRGSAQQTVDQYLREVDSAQFNEELR
ncbi:hypothetical protein SCG7086_AZ_00130 [Chlamydiales bacterium SCGC AG-110-P3]|nr:hypothetical protein SCG7086_AZ_00130 [Chlamydiales bacterium SCGC AG-110-P3]